MAQMTSGMIEETAWLERRRGLPSQSPAQVRITATSQRWRKFRGPQTEA